MIAILGVSFIFANDTVFADAMTSPDSFLKKCNDNTSQIPTLIPKSDNYSTPKQGVLLMSPNSVSMVCIKYVRPSGWHSSIDINGTKLDHPLPVEVENVHVSGSLLSFGGLFVNNVMISRAQPNVISFGSQENASTIILYTVSAKSDSRGYYHLELPYVCEDILLAVGYDTSQLDASAFQDLDKMCFNFGVETSIVGISGANMTYVDMSNETRHSTKLARNISIIPPLQQVKLFDTSAKSVLCNIGLQLIIKAEDGVPSCVKPDTVSVLVNRGWVMPNMIKSDVISDHIDIVSVKSVLPVTPGGPTVQITLKNTGIKPITSLEATLRLNNSYVFNFTNVTPSQPLAVGNSVSDTKILIGGGFTTGFQYGLAITGTQDGKPFSYDVNVHILS
ncbi:MAG: hypothetical protein ACREA1_00385 [Nitrosotalea sp.]